MNLRRLTRAATTPTPSASMTTELGSGTAENVPATFELNESRVPSTTVAAGVTFVSANESARGSCRRCRC